MFSYANPKTGTMYYLHKKAAHNSKEHCIWFFSKDATDATELPENFEVVPNPRSGYPFVRKKKAVPPTGVPA